MPSQTSCRLWSLVSLNNMRTISPELSGLEGAIRLKTELLQRLVTSAPADWPEHLAQFVRNLEAADLEDVTALVVLIADLAAEIRLLGAVRAAAVQRAGTGGHHFRYPAGLASKQEVLAWFREEVGDWSEGITQGADLNSPRVRQAVAFIDEHYAEPLTLGELAATIGCSKRHLAALFRREMGRTVHTHITLVRVRHALTLIGRGEKIEAVSLMVGYKSKTNFYRHFREIVGVKPMFYKAGLLRLRSIESAQQEP
jgi:AraC-like DNA-binding protein